MKTLLATTAIIALTATSASAGPVLDAALAKIDNAYAKFDTATVPADVISEVKELVYKIENHNAVNNIDFSALTQDADGKYTLPAIVVDKYDFTSDIATHTSNVVTHINDDFFGTAGVNPSKDFADIKIIAPVAGVEADWTVTGSGLVADKLNAEILVDLNKIQDGLDTFDYSAASLKAVLDGVDELSANVDTFNIAVDALNATEADVIGSTGTDYAHAVRVPAFDVKTNLDVEYRSEVTRASTDSIVDSFVN